MPSTTFDIAIIGTGAAGLQLALALANDPFFAEQKILLLDKVEKNQNDRTWCFWEKGAGQWDHLLRHSWAHGDFFAEGGKHHPLQLEPYRYKMLHAIDFYDFAKIEISAKSNFTWQRDKVLAVEQGEPLRIVGKAGSYLATHVFDSRITPDFFQKDDQYTRLLQHFKGWVIRTPQPAFDPSRFTMMDFRLLWPDSTSFTYVLPLSEREALVEFTLFTPEVIADEDYDYMLQRYCEEILSLRKFKIAEAEEGVIPMSDFPFEKYSKGRHIRIGTGGGWVKPSSGYSFKNCERNVALILKNLKAGRPANRGIFSKRFRFYDSLFLDVLYRQNEIGPALFATMYARNDVQTIFRFLDDQTSPGEDIGIIMKFPQLPFLRSLSRHLLRF